MAGMNGKYVKEQGVDKDKKKGFAKSLLEGTKPNKMPKPKSLSPKKGK